MHGRNRRCRTEAISLAKPPTTHSRTDALHRRYGDRRCPCRADRRQNKGSAQTPYTLRERREFARDPEGAAKAWGSLLAFMRDDALGGTITNLQVGLFAS